MEFLLVVVALIALALAVGHWGADSREGIDSPEWKRREVWGSIF